MRLLIHHLQYDTITDVIQYEYLFFFRYQYLNYLQLNTITDSTDATCIV